MHQSKYTVCERTEFACWLCGVSSYLFFPIFFYCGDLRQRLQCSWTSTYLPTGPYRQPDFSQSRFFGQSPKTLLCGKWEQSTVWTPPLPKKLRFKNPSLIYLLILVIIIRFQSNILFSAGRVAWGTTTSESNQNGATTLSHMNFSGYVRDVTIFSWMLTVAVACCIVVGLGLDLVSCWLVVMYTYLYMYHSWKWMDLSIDWTGLD